jgi:hypothetical protein
VADTTEPRAATPAATQRSTPTRAAATAPSAPAQPLGSLVVRSTPAGARVFVDGREYGRTPVTIGSLSRGSHSVRVARDGYVAAEQRLTITAGQRAHSVTVRLTPERSAALPVNASPARPASSPAGMSGVLIVDSRPPGAKVFLNGREVGSTPLELPAVPAGEHALHLELEGYRRWATAVRIVPAERNRVAASLDR